MNPVGGIVANRTAGKIMAIPPIIPKFAGVLSSITDNSYVLLDGTVRKAQRIIPSPDKKTRVVFPIVLRADISIPIPYPTRNRAASPVDSPTNRNNGCRIGVLHKGIPLEAPKRKPWYKRRRIPATSPIVPISDPIPPVPQGSQEKGANIAKE